MTQKNIHRGNTPLFLIVTAACVLLCFVVMSGAMALTLHHSLTTLQEKIDSILFSTVNTLADSPSVQQMLAAGQLDQELIVYLDSVVAYTEDLDYITIADTDSIRLYHVDHSYIGLPFEGDDQGWALAGEIYLSDAEGTFGLQHRAFAPIRDTGGTIIGFVMASASHSHILELRNDIYKSYFSLFLFLSCCTLVVMLLPAAYLNRLLHGARLSDLFRLFLTQNDVLNTLEEGLLSLDAEGRVCLVNQAASRALGFREELLLGEHIDKLLLSGDGGSLVGVTGLHMVTSRPNILLSSIALSSASSQAKQMLVLEDNSELMRQAEQLIGTRHIVTALRANNHEFLNKLQVISGLLQMGRSDEALRYIGDLSALHSRTISPVMQLIHNPNVAALILGKASNMRELDILFTLIANSHLPEHSRYLSTEELITVVGNLLENAIEATDPLPPDSLRAVSLQITEGENGLLIVVSDSGIGMEPELLDRIYDREFSTKAAEGRGMGMTLIRGITERHGGSIETDTEPGSGTIFTLIFNQERGGMNTWSV